MKIEITITAESVAEAQSILASVTGSSPEQAQPDKPKKEPKKTGTVEPKATTEVLATFSNGEKVATGASPGAAPAPTIAQRGPEPEAPATEVDPITGETVEAAPVVSYDDAKNACVSVSNKLGRDACVKLLKEFGAAKVPDLRPDQYAPIFHKAQALLSGK
jgi:hypothetical protein